MKSPKDHVRYADAAARAAVGVSGVVRLAPNGCQVLDCPDGSLDIRLRVILRTGADIRATAQTVQQAVMAAFAGEADASVTNVQVNIVEME